MSLNPLGKLLFGSIWPLDFDPSRPVYDQGLPARRNGLVNVDRIRAVPIKNGNYNVYAHLDRNPPACLPGRRKLFLGEFPADIYTALNEKKLGGYATADIYEDPLVSKFIEDKVADIVARFIDLTGVKPLYGRAPESLSHQFAAPIQTLYLTYFFAKEEQNWGSIIQSMTPVYYQELTHKMRQEGRPIDPNHIVGSIFHGLYEAYRGHIALWIGEPSYVVDAGPKPLTTPSYHTSDYTLNGERLVALRPGNYVALFRSAAEPNPAHDKLQIVSGPSYFNIKGPVPAIR